MYGLLVLIYIAMISTRLVFVVDVSAVLHPRIHVFETENFLQAKHQRVLPSQSSDATNSHGN